MTRDDAIARSERYFDSGQFLEDLRRRVAYPTESGVPARRPDIRAYLESELVPAVRALGATAAIHDNPGPRGGPLLLARRHEAGGLPTVLTYGHADVVPAEPERWRAGLDPWRVTVEGDRWYGRGSADNKGQHSINLAALDAVLKTRGRLGFNLMVLVESAEETGSPGLDEFARSHAGELRGDVLIGSDATRVAAGKPTIFLGSRGSAPFTLRVALRERSHHSGNWGGLLRNPATVLANAIASLTDGRGRILIDALRRPDIPDDVRAALATITPGGGPDDPEVDADWGDPDLTPAERMAAGNTLEVLSLAAGSPDRAVNAIPGAAHAHLQLRYAPGTDVTAMPEAIRKHLDDRGFGMVEVIPGTVMHASRTDLAGPWVRFAAESLQRTAGSPPVLLPNIGGGLPNAVFTGILGMPTVWVPHSYPACAQHAPDEHLLGSLARDALRLMTGLFWDLGEAGRPGPWRPGG